MFVGLSVSHVAFLRHRGASTHPPAAFCDPCLRALFSCCFSCNFAFSICRRFFVRSWLSALTCLSLLTVFDAGSVYHSLAIFLFDSWPSTEDTRDKTGCLAGSRFNHMLFPTV